MSFCGVRPPSLGGAVTTVRGVEGSMWTQRTRRVAIALVLVGLVAACKKDKPTEPPNDDEPTADVR